MGCIPHLVFVAILAAGCSPTVKRTETLNTFTAPQQWSAGETLSGPSEKDWWSYFGHSGLEQAVGTNIDLRAAAARVSQALSDARIAGVDKYPAIDVGLSNGRGRQSFVRWLRGTPARHRTLDVVEPNKRPKLVGVATMPEPDDTVSVAG